MDISHQYGMVFHAHVFLGFTLVGVNSVRNNKYVRVQQKQP